MRPLIPFRHSALLLGLLLASQSTSRPCEAAGTTDGPRSRNPDRFRSNQNWAVELRFGPYRPDVDSEFGGAATPFTDLFGTGSSVGVGLEVDWQALRIPHFGSIGPGLGFTYVGYSAQALRQANPAERSAQPTAIRFLPLDIVGVLRLDVLAKDFRIPIVPYVKGGFVWTLWDTDDGGTVGQANGVEGKGAETGLVAMVGGMFLLDFLAPQAAIDMDNNTGVNHAYLFGEWMMSDVSTFQSGLQTGTSTWQVGLAMEF